MDGSEPRRPQATCGQQRRIPMPLHVNLSVSGVDELNAQLGHATEALRALGARPLLVGTSLRRLSQPIAPPPAPFPLSELDDLDEGLICCGRRYPTFKAYMTHRREHHEGG